MPEKPKQPTKPSRGDGDSKRPPPIAPRDGPTPYKRAATPEVAKQRADRDAVVALHRATAGQRPQGNAGDDLRGVNYQHLAVAAEQARDEAERRLAEVDRQRGEAMAKQPSLKAIEEAFEALYEYAEGEYNDARLENLNAVADWLRDYVVSARKRAKK